MSFSKYILSILIPSLKLQLSITIGMFFSLKISLIYYFLNNPKYPKENPLILFVGFFISFLFYQIGNFLENKIKIKSEKSIKTGALIVFFTWLIAIITCSIVFFLADFPDPNNIEKYSLFRRIIDSIFESISGFSTTGASILPKIESIPRGILMLRSITNFIGGMGIAFLSLTLIRKTFPLASEIANSEAEIPIIKITKDLEFIKKSGLNFLKIYILLTLILFLLLIISGALFRQKPYDNLHENIYDSLIYSFGTIATGGFSNYDSSVGLTITENGKNIIGGLRNPISEWIIAFFMFIAGSNLAIIYEIIYRKKIFFILKNLEFKVYFFFVFILSIIIFYILQLNNFQNLNWLDNLRYSFFNVATIISTTGFANSDFTLWPASAQGLLFLGFIIGGGMVGSTSGGLKIHRFLVTIKSNFLEIKGIVTDKIRYNFKIDKELYNKDKSRYVLMTMYLYFIIFILGAIGIMILSPQVKFVDGTIKNIDLVSSFTASISILGNIGPAVSVGNVNSGPTGNYFAYSESAKILMFFLMYISRIGVISFLMMFVTRNPELIIEKKEKQTDSDLIYLIR